MTIQTKKILDILLAIPVLIIGATSCEMTTVEDPIASHTAYDENVSESTHGYGANLRLGNNLIFQETFEGSNPFSTAHGLELGADHSLTFVKRPGSTSSDNLSARIELRDNDPTVKGSRRAEVTIVKGEDGDIEKDSWYAFEVNVPKDYIDEDDDEVINQWHQNGNASAAIRIKNGRFLWRFYIDGKKTDFDLGDIKKDAWTTFVIHMVHSYGTDGLTQVWVNDQKLMDQKGRNINNDPLPKWKIGIYKSEWASAKTTTNKRILYFDNVMVGNQNTSFEELKSGLGNPTSPESGSPSENDPVLEPSPETPPAGNENKPPVTDIQEPGTGTGLTFINAHSDKDIYQLLEGGTLSLLEQKTYKISVRANPVSSSVGSVKFELSGSKSYNYTDNAPPYALFGDDGKGNYYYGPGMAEGKYSLKITAYTEPKGRGSVIESNTVNFTINNSTTTPGNQVKPLPTLPNPSPEQNIPEPAPSESSGGSISGISLLTFVNAQLDRDIFSLEEGARISLGKEGTHKISVRADLTTTSIKSVKFELSGGKSYSYIDNAAPFAMFGDDAKGNYFYGPGMTPGSYTLKITTYTELKGKGKVFGSKTVHFIVQN